MRTIVGISGASGVIIGIRLIEELAARDHDVHAVLTPSAWEVIRHEVSGDFRFPESIRLHDGKGSFSPLFSSSFRADAMVVAPCSMKSLSGIASGYAESLLVRAADGMLRTGRQLVLVPRETPLSLSALENMAALKRGGAVILPPMAAYYHRPKTVEAMTDFFVGKILDVLDIDNELFTRWEGKE